MKVRKFVKRFIPKNLFKRIEPYGHLAEAVLLNALNGFPARGLNVIGVTGTNGKTTTCYLIHRMLREAGYNVGLMTTVAYGVNDDIRPQQYHMTNVSVPELMKRLKFMKSQGAEWLVLETTSHALAQNRVWGVPYSVAVLTNLTHEHLDYHGTFERYRDAKKKLFTLTNKNRRGLRLGVINADDPSAEVFSSAIDNTIMYGQGNGELQAINAKLSPSGSRYVARCPSNVVISHQSPVTSQNTEDRRQKTSDNTEYHIQCNLPGSFNVANSLAAIGVGIALGLDKKQIEKGIASLKRVEGRMDPIDEGQDFSVIVDFAHTPDSFEKLFKDLRPVVKGKLICMFGSAGRRDEAKRVIQGRLAGEYCDEVVITEEDDRDIDGLEIMNQIAEGAETAGKVREKDLFLVHDRSEAIKFAINRASMGDTVLLLGKGHEKTIERADGEHPWDEIATTREVLK